MSTLKKRIDALSDAKRELLITLLKEQNHVSENSRHSSDYLPPTTVQLVAYVTPRLYKTPGHSNTMHSNVASIDESNLRKFVATKLPEFMRPTYYIELETLPRLPNGKLAENELPIPSSKRSRERDQSGDVTEATKTLTSILSKLLAFDDIRSDDNFFEIGGDSITAIQFVSKAREAGIQLDISAITSQPTIAQLAEFGVNNDPISDQPAAQSEEPTGRTPLSPIQNWFFSQNHSQPEHWNQADYLQLVEGVDIDALRRAIQSAAADHPVLASQFTCIDGIWTCNIPDELLPIDAISTMRMKETDGISQITEKLSELQNEFDLSEGWLIKFLIIENQSRSNFQFCWIAHHLIIDMFSSHVLLQHIADHYFQEGLRANTSRNQASMSYREWAIKLTSLYDQRHADKKTPSGETETRDSYVISRSSESAETGIQENPGVEKNFNTYSTYLNEKTTAQLIASNSIYRSRTLELLLASLQFAFNDVIGMEKVTIDIETHGRDALGETADVSNSIGWFTDFFPCTLPRYEYPVLDKHILMVKEAFRLQRKENMYFLLDHYKSENFSSQRDRPSDQPISILLNYMGHNELDVSGLKLFTKRIDLPVAFLRSPDNSRSHDLEINMLHINQQLHLNFSYFDQIISNQSLEAIASVTVNYLEKIIYHSQDSKSTEYIPSDFPDAGLNQDELNDFLSNLDL